MIDAATYSLFGHSAEIHLHEYETMRNLWALYGRIIDGRTGGSKYRMKDRAVRHILSPVEEGASPEVIEPAEGADAYLYPKEFAGQYLLTDSEQEDAEADGDSIVPDTLAGAAMSGWDTLMYWFNWFLQHGFIVLPAAAGYSGGDGLPLFSNSHPIKKGVTTYNDNLLGALPLTPDNLATGRTTLAQQKDGNGRQIGNLRRLILFVGENYRQRAVETIGGPTVAYTAALTPNVFGPSLANALAGLEGIPNVEVLPFWTDADDASGWEWVLGEQYRMQRSIRCKLTRSPRVEVDRLPNGRMINPTVSLRAAFGAITPTCAVGANPASDTAP